MHYKNLKVPQHEGRKIKVALMSYAIDGRQAKGTALYARKLIEKILDDSRFEFTLVHYERTDDPLYKRAREVVIPHIPRLPFGTRFVRMMIFFWKYRNEGFDIVHWFQPRLYPFFWFVPARKIVVTAHGGGDACYPHAFIFSRFVFVHVMKIFGRYIHATIGDSEFARLEIIQAYGLPPDRVHGILLGGGEDYVLLNKEQARARMESLYGIRSPFILDVSRLEPHKNVGGAVKAYTRAREIGVLPHALVIVGFRESDAQNVWALARASKFAGSISFVNYVDGEDLNALYSAADLFLFPSFNEGFGLSIVEAFASGVPIVTSNTTSLPEIAGDAAITVDPTDTEALAEAIRSVVLDRTLHETLTQKGLARARQFTWGTTAKKTLELYVSLLS
jgi:glycosyltransferase involved in cell wall biosynthesis